MEKIIVNSEICVILSIELGLSSSGKIASSTDCLDEAAEFKIRFGGTNRGCTVPCEANKIASVTIYVLSLYCKMHSLGVSIA